jgi:tetratricopeptide (TPR) repeat protein
VRRRPPAVGGARSSVAGTKPLDQEALSGTLGTVDHEQGRPEAAVGRLANGLSALQDQGDLQAQAHLLPELALAHLAQDRVDEAIVDLRRSLRIARCTGDLLAEAIARHHLGQAHARQGRLGPAIPCTRRSLRTFRDLGAPYWEARALDSIAPLFAATGPAG